MDVSNSREESSVTLLQMTLNAGKLIGSMTMAFFLFQPFPLIVILSSSEKKTLIKMAQ